MAHDTLIVTHHDMLGPAVWPRKPRRLFRFVISVRSDVDARQTGEKRGGLLDVPL
jgi:hypothetical protein